MQDANGYKLREVGFKTFSHYTNLGFSQDRSFGFVAENYFRIQRGIEPVYSN